MTLRSNALGTDGFDLGKTHDLQTHFLGHAQRLGKNPVHQDDVLQVRNAALALDRDEAGHVIHRPPAEVVAELNHLLLGEMETEHYFTLMLAFLDMETGLVVLSQAGHPHPVVQRADGRVEQFGPGGFPVGLVESATYACFELQLEPGDRLMILSDGITECPDRGGNLLGERGLERILVRLKDIRDKPFLEALIWDLARFAGQDEFPDDVSALVFDYRGPGAA